MESRRSPISVVLGLLGLAAVFWFLWRVEEVLIYFALAVALSFVLAPVVEWLARHRVPRPLAVLGMFIVTGLVLAVVITLLVPVAIAQLKQLINEFPKYFHVIEKLWARFGELVASDRMPDAVKDLPHKLAGNIQRMGGKVSTGIFHGILGFFSTATNLIVVPVLTYYFLQDSGRLRAAFLKSLPADRRAECDLILTRTSTALGGFIRGQIKLCLAVGVLSGVGMTVIGLPYALLLGLLAGAVEFIPYLGPILGMLIPLIVASFISFKMVLIVAAIFAVVQVLENNVLVPRIMGGELGMHPVFIIFVLMAGGQVAGIGGMVAAVPVAVIFKVLYDHFYIEKIVRASENLTDAPVTEL